VDDTWRIGWLAGRRRVVALGSDVAEEDEEDSDSCGGDADKEDTRRVYSSGGIDETVCWEL
jgi:hypothetical protein